LDIQGYLSESHEPKNGFQEIVNTASLSIVLDNIRSALNVGSILRTADGCGVKKIHLCGATATPENSKVSKTGLGAEWSLPWEYHPNTFECVCNLMSNTRVILALEQTCKSSSLLRMNPEVLKNKEVILIIGNELTGVDPAVLEKIDHHVSLPMLGFKKSLNVAVAFGIAAYFIQFSSQGDCIQLNSSLRI